MHWFPNDDSRWLYEWCSVSFNVFNGAIDDSWSLKGSKWWCQCGYEILMTNGDRSNAKGCGVVVSMVFAKLLFNWLQVWWSTFLQGKSLFKVDLGYTPTVPTDFGWFLLAHGIAAPSIIRSATSIRASSSWWVLRKSKTQFDRKHKDLQSRPICSRGW